MVLRWEPGAVLRPACGAVNVKEPATNQQLPDVSHEDQQPAAEAHAAAPAGLNTPDNTTVTLDVFLNELQACQEHAQDWIQPSLRASQNPAASSLAERPAASHAPPPTTQLHSISAEGVRSALAQLLQARPSVTGPNANQTSSHPNVANVLGTICVPAAAPQQAMATDAAAEPGLLSVYRCGCTGSLPLGLFAECSLPVFHLFLVIRLQVDNTPQLHKVATY